MDPRWLRQLPKAEVHCHLEGCVPPSLVEDAARHRGLDPAGAPRLPVGDLPALLAYLDWSCRLVDSADDLSTIARGVVERSAAAGTRHVDVLCNPTHWGAWCGRLDEMVAALDRGFADGEVRWGTTATLCLSVKRTQSAEEAVALVDWILSARPPRVSGLSIDGDEAGGTASHTERFEEAFARAAAGGLRRCAHAGESSGPDGVRDAVDRLGAERVDHGIRAVEDRRLVGELAERRVPLDVCPSSNVILGVVRSLAEHPVAPLLAAGVRVSLNTDDPLLYGVDVPGEYRRCAEQFGWDRAVLGEVARTSIDSCFAAAERREALLVELDRFLGA
ncbi:MAG: adenosine deaminase [Acidimicrobiales bacterium]